MTGTWLPLLAGLVLLVAGGELLVRGAVQVATALGVSPLVIGLTLVGFGTSTPELVASVQAALSGSPGIAYGNVVGSNIANTLLIGGIAALLFPLAVASSALQRDGVLLLATVAAFAIVSAIAPLGRLIGLASLLLLAGYLALAFHQERGTTRRQHGADREKSAARQNPQVVLPAPAPPGPSIVRSALVALAGLTLVVGGGALLVDGAVSLARDLGISETVIGLTVVAVGTSLPELITSVTASLRRQAAVALGNIIGSNIYNILGIAGATALVAPGEVPGSLVAFDNLVMIFVTVLLILFAWTGHRISRWEGALLLSGYALYLYAIWP